LLVSNLASFFPAITYYSPVSTFLNHKSHYLRSFQLRKRLIIPRSWGSVACCEVWSLSCSYFMCRTAWSIHCFRLIMSRPRKSFQPFEFRPICRTRFAEPILLKNIIASDIYQVANLLGWWTRFYGICLIQNLVSSWTWVIPKLYWGGALPELDFWGL